MTVMLKSGERLFSRTQAGGHPGLTSGILSRIITYVTLHGSGDVSQTSQNGDALKKRMDFENEHSHKLFLGFRGTKAPIMLSCAEKVGNAFHTLDLIYNDLPKTSIAEVLRITLSSWFIMGQYRSGWLKMSKAKSLPKTNVFERRKG